jgi:hypothetical protein
MNLTTDQLQMAMIVALAVAQLAFMIRVTKRVNKLTDKAEDDG